MHVLFGMYRPVVNTTRCCMLSMRPSSDFKTIMLWACDARRHTSSMWLSCSSSSSSTIMVRDVVALVSVCGAW